MSDQRLRMRDARLQPREHEEVAVAALRRRIFGRGERIVRDAPVRGRPQRGAIGIIDARRHDADDRVRLVVETNRLADDVRSSAETSFPETVAQNGDPRRARALVARLEAAADRRRDAEHVEEIRVDHRAADALRPIARRQRVRFVPQGGHPGEAAIARAPVQEVRRRGVSDALFRLTVDLRDEHQRVRRRRRAAAAGARRSRR